MLLPRFLVIAIAVFTFLCYMVLNVFKTILLNKNADPKLAPKRYFSDAYYASHAT